MSDRPAPVWTKSFLVFNHGENRAGLITILTCRNERKNNKKQSFLRAFAIPTLLSPRGNRVSPSSASGKEECLALTPEDEGALDLHKAAKAGEVGERKSRSPSLKCRPSTSPPPPSYSSLQRRTRSKKLSLSLPHSLGADFLAFSGETRFQAVGIVFAERGEEDEQSKQTFQGFHIKPVKSELPVRP